MRKKLNRKLKFALAGLGAFALAGVSCAGLVSLENQDAIASYAIDTPTDGNPVQFGVFTFSKIDNNYYVDFTDVSIINSSDLVVNTLYSFNFTDGTYTGADFNFDPVAIDNGWLIPGGHYRITQFQSQFIDKLYMRCNYTYNGTTVTDNFFCSDVDTHTYTFNGNTMIGIDDPAPSPVDYVHDIVDIFVAGITKLGQGIGQGVSSFVQSLAFNAVGDGLSIYFILVCVFGGIALAVALTSKIFMWLNGLGA